MSKAAMTKAGARRNGRETAPIERTPAVAEVILEGAVLVAETPEEEEIFELVGVPYLGPTRIRALALAGIRTLEDLRAATATEIGGVRGVGMGNATRIKQWLTAQDAVPAPAPVAVPLPATSEVPLDLDLAASNQAIQDDMANIDQAITRIQRAIPQRVAHKKLDRQVDKLLGVLSELAEGPDTLRPKQLGRALKMLHVIAALFDKFADVGHLSEKIVTAFAEELRDRRKRLQEILDPKK